MHAKCSLGRVSVLDDTIRCIAQRWPALAGELAQVTPQVLATITKVIELK